MQLSSLADFSSVTFNILVPLRVKNKKQTVTLKNNSLETRIPKEIGCKQ